MTGVIPVDKPKGQTSRQTTSFVSRLAGKVKAGHAGTLDPMATGVLPVLLGAATRLCDLLPGDKTYVVTFRTGLATDSGDITGNVLYERDADIPSERVMEAALSFVGRIMQVPPMHSAIKRDGQPLYRLARQGITVERQPRPADIYSITDFEALPGGEYRMTVRCSKGTYMRSLCDDIGAKLGVGAVMTALRRTESAGIPSTRCLSPDELCALSEAGRLTEALIPPEELFSHCPRVGVEKSGVRYYQNGGVIDARRLSLRPEEGTIYRVYGPDSAFLGLGRLWRAEAGDGIAGLKSVWSPGSGAHEDH